MMPKKGIARMESTVRRYRVDLEKFLSKPLGFLPKFPYQDRVRIPPGCMNPSLCTAY